MLLCDVQGGWRNPQVLPSPRKQKAKRDHLSLMPGMETTPRMAPRKKERSGWMSAPQLFLPNYACHWSRSYAPCLRQTTTDEWQKPLGFNRRGVSQHNRNVSFYVHMYCRRRALSIIDQNGSCI